MSVGLRIIVGVLSIFCLVIRSAPVRADLSSEASPPQEMWLAVLLNGQPAGSAVFVLRTTDDRVWVRSDDVRDWRFPLPTAPPLAYAGEEYYPLDALAGLTYRVDESSQSLSVEAPPGLFGATRLRSASQTFDAPTRPPLGGFLNYDVVADRVEDFDVRTAGLLEASMFGAWGAATTRFLGRDQTDETDMVRLDTTWTYDRPEDRTSFRLGDAITGSSRVWGGAVRFGGVQWATNFTTQPSLVTFPLPTLEGEAVVPSTVDLYVNGALRLRRDIPAGPFSVEDVPMVTGQGQAQLVVRDLLGREQVITQSYYTSPRLLRQGLHDYSYEAGVVRRNYTRESNDYGRAVISGTHRLGLTGRLTGEIHAELLEDQQTLGLSAAYLAPVLGVLSGAVAGSESESGNGFLTAFGFERQARWLSFGGNIQIASENFRHLGLLERQLAPRQQSRVFASFSLGRLGSVSLAHVDQDYRDQVSTAVSSASYSTHIGRLTYVSLTAFHVDSDESDTIIGLNFTRALGQRVSTGMSATSQNTSRQALMQLQRNPPVGRGYGFRMQAGAVESDDGERTSRGEATLNLQSDIGAYVLEAGQTQDQTRVRAGVRGGFAFLGRHMFATRLIDNSFAVAQVGDRSKVRVYNDNQLVGHTNDRGFVLLPVLRPYQENQIRIEQADLPLDVEIASLQMKAVPYFRSGLLLKFDVRGAAGGLVTILLEDGKPLPAGAIVRIPGREEEFPVGANGELYLTGLAANNRLHATWNEQSCEIDFAFTPSDDPLPQLGTYVCKGVSR